MQQQSLYGGRKDREETQGCPAFFRQDRSRPPWKIDCVTCFNTLDAELLSSSKIISPLCTDLWNGLSQNRKVNRYLCSEPYSWLAFRKMQPVTLQSELADIPQGERAKPFKHKFKLEPFFGVIFFASRFMEMQGKPSGFWTVFQKADIGRSDSLQEEN